MHDAPWVGGTNWHGCGDLDGPGEFSRHLPFGCIYPLAVVPSESGGHMGPVYPHNVFVLLEFRMWARRASFRVSSGAFH